MLRAGLLARSRGTSSPPAGCSPGWSRRRRSGRCRSSRCSEQVEAATPSACFSATVLGRVADARRVVDRVACRARAPPSARRSSSRSACRGGQVERRAVGRWRGCRAAARSSASSQAIRREARLAAAAQHRVRAGGRARAARRSLQPRAARSTSASTRGVQRRAWCSAEQAQADVAQVDAVDRPVAHAPWCRARSRRRRPG